MSERESLKSRPVAAMIFHERSGVQTNSDICLVIFSSRIATHCIFVKEALLGQHALQAKRIEATDLFHIFVLQQLNSRISSQLEKTLRSYVTLQHSLSFENKF